MLLSWGKDCWWSRRAGRGLNNTLSLFLCCEAAEQFSLSELRKKINFPCSCCCILFTMVARKSSMNYEQCPRHGRHDVKQFCLRSVRLLEHLPFAWKNLWQFSVKWNSTKFQQTWVRMSAHHLTAFYFLPKRLRISSRSMKKQMVQWFSDHSGKNE